MNLNNFQIELVQGCTRRCDFCGINQLSREDLVPVKCMTTRLAKNIARQISEQFKEKIRIEFAVGGEPLMNPNSVQIIKTFRKYLPLAQLSVISNGDPILKNNDLILDLFNNGLNYIMLDFYEGNTERRDNEIKALLKQVEKEGISIKDFYKDNIHIWQYRSNKIKEVVMVPPIEEYSGVSSTRTLHSAGGNMPKEVWKKYGIKKEKFPIMQRCAKPFREMTIKYDGHVPLCCNDWRRQAGVGNVNNAEGTRIIDIWESDEMNVFRYILHNKRRDLIDVCYWCSERSQRTGLLKLDEGKEYPELLKNAKPVYKNDTKLF